MQLLAIILYSHRGDRRTVSFKPGALNVVTGDSATGKSALLDIVEYCLGRDSVTLPLGPLTTAVSWYAALFQMDDSRAFVARPVPGHKRASRNQAMLRFGRDQQPLEYAELRAELDAEGLREQLGRRIGIRENIAPAFPFEADLSHAALLCFQGQTEIANNKLLFHRQSERGIAGALRATLPYFIGAVPPAQARTAAQATAARHEADTLQEDYSLAVRAESATRHAIAPLWDEARRLGMLSHDVPADPMAAVEGLRRAITADRAPDLTGNPSEDRMSDLRRQNTRHRDELRALAADRQTLLDHIDAASDYSASLKIPLDRLTSLNLLGLTIDQQQSPTAEADASNCPLCGSELRYPDPTPAALNHSLEHLAGQLAAVTSVPVAGRRELERLDARAAELRGQLREAEEMLQVLFSEQGLTEHLSAEGRVEFLRGRIHGVLSALPATSPEQTSHLERRRDVAEAQASVLETALDRRAIQQELEDRLVAIDRDITTWARQLGLEPADSQARLDVKRLNIAFRTPHGRATLSDLGSGQNWVGYHVITHLALHRYFVRNNRPVPRILMLDQPTQAWLPGTGGPPAQADQEAMADLFRQIDSVVRELAPAFQVIVVDHANLPQPWFQEAVVHNWRGEEKLVPRDWLESDE
ncbi:DUF3732 domain-containing protein [Kitasatospora sp. NPDC059795]|uniref:DUF3732 domain-containing protein n=1 Tax=Kitasatospora sp. NPDC059795 TaxID=3346949 RepID=UPI00365F36B5